MSLINDMLKDLEARGGNVAGTVRPAPASTPAVVTSRSLVALLAALVIGLAAALTYIAWPKQSAPLAADETPRPELPPVAAPAQEPPMTNKPATAASVLSEPSDAAETAASAETVQPITAVVLEDMPAVAPADAAPVSAGDEKSADNGVVIVRRHEPTPEQRARRAARDGFAALRRGDWLVAARLLQELVELEPANDDAREALAAALQRQGRLAEVDGVLLDGIALGAEPARFAKMRARIQMARNDAAGALNTLSIAVPAVHDDPEYHALKGAIAQQAGEFQQAVVTYTALTLFEPANATWQAGLAMALDRTGDVRGAQTAYQRALEAGGLEPALLAHAQRRLAALNNE